MKIILNFKLPRTKRESSKKVDSEEMVTNSLVFTEKFHFSILKLRYQIYVTIISAIRKHFQKLRAAIFIVNIHIILPTWCAFCKL